jgi:aquaporin Z
LNIRAIGAEAIGTFILVFIGSLGIAGAIIATSGQDPTVIILLTVPFAFGLGLLAAIAIGGATSGGHFNPAVTLAALFDGRITWVDAIGYAVAQIIGGLAASLAILLLLSKEFVGATVNRAGQTATDVGTQQVHAFAAEIILTAIFVAVILTVTRRAPSQAIIVIPLTLVVIHFAGILISGASVNPVRSLGPAVVSGDYDGLWVYLTAPFLGSIIGWGVFKLLSPGGDEGADEGDDEEDDLDDIDDIDDELEVEATRA